MKFRSRTRISFGMKTGMNSFRNKSHFRYHANSPLSFVELIIDAFDDASIVLIFFLMIYIMFAEITFVCVYSEDGTIVSFRLDKCFVFWQISGIFKRSIPVNWPFWSCRGWSGRHLFPSAKLTFSLSGCHKTFHFSYMKLPCRLTLTVTLTKWFDMNTYSNNPNPNLNLTLTLTLTLCTNH